MSEPGRIREALAGTDLVNFEMQPVPVLDTGEVGFCWEVPVDAARALWRQARPHAETLGRWPVLVPEPFYPDTFSRFYYDGAGDQSPAAVLRRAAAMAPDEVWDVYPPPSPAPWDDEIRGRVPGEHLDWEPWSDGTCGLMLMPTARSWEVPAYTSFYGASRPLGHEALVRVMREWQARFGAELAASWGTELLFQVDRPPSDIDAAYALARQQVAVAEYTVAGPCVPVGQHARALLHRAEWYLHERP